MGEKKKPPYKLFVLVLALLLIVAYYISGVFKDHGGIEQFEERLLKVLMNPLQNYFHPKITPVAFFIAIILWLFFISRYLIYNRNFLPDKEFGSAQWANPVKAAKKLQAPKQEDNRILSENVRVNLYGNSQAGTGLSNNNVLLVGSPGTGKTMFELTPNILLASRSMVFLDVKGEILRKYGNYLKKKGYVVRVLNLKEFQYSNGYNPFAYIAEEADIPRVIRNILSALDPPEAQKNDPFWEQGSELYLQALFYYVWLEIPKAKQNLNRILELVNAESRIMYQLQGPEGEVLGKKEITHQEYLKLQEENPMLAGLYAPNQERTELAYLMDQAIKEGKHRAMGINHPAWRDYYKLKGGAAETVRSIVLIINAKLKFFEMPGLKRIFDRDEMDLQFLGSGVNYDGVTKTAIFLVCPENDTSYNFVMGMFYQQLFDTLIRTADLHYNGWLPIGVDVWMDEFANGARPERFEFLINSLRSRNIAAIPIIQQIGQLKNLYKNDAWEQIVGGCAAFVFLGAGRGDYSTQKYISDLLDKATIDKKDDSISGGNQKSGSLQFGKQARELMTPGEVGTMPLDKCIVLLQGHDPILDYKYHPFEDKNYKEAMALGPYESDLVVRQLPDGRYVTMYQPDTSVFVYDRDSEAVCHYKERAKTDSRMLIFDFGRGEGDLLEQFSFLEQLNLWTRPESLEEQLQKAAAHITEKANEEKEIEGEQEEKGENKEEYPKIYSYLVDHQAELTPGQREQIFLGMKTGLSEAEILSYVDEEEEVQVMIREMMTKKRYAT